MASPKEALKLLESLGPKSVSPVLKALAKLEKASFTPGKQYGPDKDPHIIVGAKVRNKVFAQGRTFRTDENTRFHFPTGKKNEVVAQNGNSFFCTKCEGGGESSSGDSCRHINMVLNHLYGT